MRRWWPLSAFVLLLFASVWTIISLFNAVTGGEGHGGVFWTAVALLIILAALLLGATWRVGRRVRAVFASRPQGTNRRRKARRGLPRASRGAGACAGSRAAEGGKTTTVPFGTRPRCYQSGVSDYLSCYQPATSCLTGYSLSRPSYPPLESGSSAPKTGKRPAGRDLSRPAGAAQPVGATGFEPATFRPPAECATRLRHAPLASR
jgi:hypothetical protein